MSFTLATQQLIPRLGQHSPEELDEIPYGVVQLAVDGRVLSFNKTEAVDLGWLHERPIGRDYFSDVAPSAFGPEVFGRHVNAVTSHSLNEVFRFTFSHATPPRTVLMHMHYSARTGTVWIFTANPDGSSITAAGSLGDSPEVPFDTA